METRTASYTVTPADIANGCRSISDCCPHALAIRRDLRAASVAVGVATAHVRGSELLPDGSYHLPLHATAWIVEFDAGRPVEPITVALSTDRAHNVVA
ncbi:MAG TPA: hypothetical protein VGH33_06990 [Isosphaeraceae bacterium]